MDYAAEMTAIRQRAQALGQYVRQLTWSLQRTNPDDIRAHVAGRVRRLDEESEAFRRSGPEQHRRAAAEMESEEIAQRTLGAQTARFNVEPKVSALQTRIAHLKTVAEGDISRTLPNALDRIDPAAMVQIHILREQRRPRLETAPVRELLRAYFAAESPEAFGPAAWVDMTLLEEIVPGRDGSLARDESELETAVTLRPTR